MGELKEVFAKINVLISLSRRYLQGSKSGERLLYTIVIRDAKFTREAVILGLERTKNSYP